MKIEPQIWLLRADTHRGHYDFWRMSLREGQRWSACFHAWTGHCDSLRTVTSWDDAVTAAQVHADAQPDFPPMLGWPADAEID